MKSKSGLTLIVVLVVIIAVALLTSCSTQVVMKQGYHNFLETECYICHQSNDLNVAHGYPQILAKGTALEYLITTKTNCITLCRRCHSVFHGNDFGHKYSNKLIPLATELRDSLRTYKEDQK
jgi:cytochrome c553